MRTLTVQAYEDQSRPEGGHAVIVVHGLDLDGSESPELSFRLRPIDASGDGSRAADWVDSGRGDVNTRRTGQGVELLIGPDIADNEQLLPGTVIEIEFPEAGARGEFLWPNIAPVLRPKRRNIVVNRARRPKGEGEPAAGNGAYASETKPETPAAALGSKPEPPAKAPAPQPAPPVQSSPSPAAEARPAALEAATPVQDALAALEAVVAAAQPKKEDDPMPSSKLSALREDDKPAARPQTSETAAITAGESWYESARGSHRVASEPAPSRRPQKASTSLAATGGILLVTLAGIYMLSRDPGSRHTETPSPGGGVTVAAPSAAPAAPVATPTPSFAAPAVPAPAATAGKGEREPSLFDVLAAGTVSPRGVNAAGIDGAKALENANALLQGPNRDLEEGAFWLRRFLQSSLSDERTMRVLTQLGSAYAEPQGRAPDYVKARLLWEIASAAGDPVAMCFIGLMHENGLGTTLDKKVALQWYERSKKAGGCPQVDDMIARARL